MSKKQNNKNQKPNLEPAGKDYGGVLVLLGLMVVAIIPLIFSPKFLYDMYDLAKATALRVALILIMTGWAWRIYKTREISWRRTPLDIAVFAFMLGLLVSTIFSSNATMSIVGGYKRHEGLITWFSYLLIFFTATNWIKQKWQAVTIAIPFFIATMMMTIYGIFQHYGIDFLQFGAQYDVFRSFATSGNPVFLGGYLAFVAPLFIALFLNAKDYIVKGLLLIASSLILICLFFTMTRGGWLALIAAMLIFIPLIPASIYKRNFAWIGGFLAVALVGFYVLFVVIQPTQQMAHTASDLLPRLKEVSSMGGSAGTRAEMWKTSASMIKENPVTGIGIETYKDFFPKHRTLGLIKLEGEMAMPDRPHNEFFYLPTILGIPGYLAYIWFIAGFVMLMIRYRFRIEDESYRMLFVGVLGAAVAYWVQAFFSFSMIIISATFWLVCGIAVSMGASKIREDKRLVPFKKISFAVPKWFGQTFVGVVVLASVILSVYSYRAIAADYYYFRGIELRSYSTEAAAGAYEQAVNNNPTLNLYRLMLASTYYEMATRTNDKAWVQKSKDIFDGALRYDEKDEDILGGLGDLNQYVAYQFNDQSASLKALEIYQKAIDIDPNFSHALLAASRILLTNGQGGIAENYLNRVLAITSTTVNPTSYIEALNSLAVVYAQRGQYQTATDYCNEVLKTDKTNAIAKEQLKRIKVAWKKG